MATRIDAALYDRLQALREGGHTERAHTIPHIGTYKVSEHSHQVLLLLLLLHPDPSQNLVRAVVFHDLTERYAGDIPGHAKYWHSLELGRAHAALSDQLDKRLGIAPILTEDEEAWLRGCDILEFYLWCEDQMGLGNMHVLHVRDNVRRYIAEHLASIPVEIVEFIAGYRWQRTHDNGFWRADK